MLQWVSVFPNLCLLSGVSHVWNHFIHSSRSQHFFPLLFNSLTVYIIKVSRCLPTSPQKDAPMENWHNCVTGSVCVYVHQPVFFTHHCSHACMFVNVFFFLYSESLWGERWSHNGRQQAAHIALSAPLISCEHDSPCHSCRHLLLLYLPLTYSSLASLIPARLSYYTHTHTHTLKLHIFIGYPDLTQASCSWTFSREK